ncbi:MAG: hypothetical protein ACPF8Y_07850 [Flavobacteriales bacterium]
MNNNLLPYVLGALSTATLAMALFISVDKLHAEQNGIVLHDIPDPLNAELVSALH